MKKDRFPLFHIRISLCASLFHSSSSAALFMNAALVGLWLWLYRAVFPYLGVIFTREEFRTNQIILLGSLALVAAQLRKTRLVPRPDALPQLHRTALVFMLGGSVLYLLAERFLDINTLSTALAGLATYGLLGLWLSPRRWRQGLPAALLLIGALPFGEHMQTFIGYPVRLATASIVRDGLGALGVHSLGVDTILVFENGISQVDLPCSGVKSLWTGGLFFLAATWIERRPVNGRWLLAGVIFTTLLLAANLARVAALVTVGQVLGWRLLAEMLHVPLGVLGFAGACAAAVLLLRAAGTHKETGAPSVNATESGRMEDIALMPGALVPGLEESAASIADSAQPDNSPMRNPPANASPRGSGTARPAIASSLPGPAWLAPLLCLAVLILSLLYTPRQGAVSAQPPGWQPSPALAAQPWPLEPGEQQWLAEAGVQGASRWRFTWRGQPGSLLLVASSTWRAHHRPERCFEVYGLAVDESRTSLIAPDFPARLLRLSGKIAAPLTDNGQEGAGSEGTADGNITNAGRYTAAGRFTAAYWLQSASRTTDDFGARIWADLSPEREKWVLVTILFDGAPDPDSADARALYTELRAMVAKNLAK